MLYTAAIAFFGGAVYEASAVAWVHYSEKRSPWLAGLFSMVCAGALVAGIGESVRDYSVAPWFILGYGFGTVAAVKWGPR